MDPEKSRRLRMKLTDAQDFQRKMIRLQDSEEVDLDTLYEMRRVVQEYYQAGYCGIGVFAHFKEKIREAIYEKLKEVEDGSNR